MVHMSYVPDARYSPESCGDVTVATSIAIALKSLVTTPEIQGGGPPWERAHEKLRGG
jgi:hypothetical protein